jgi:hypothetical protein
MTKKARRLPLLTVVPLAVRVSVIGLPLILVLLGCSEAPERSSVRADESFPNSVGSQWVYAVFDSMANSWDTVRVDIISTVDIGFGDRASVWRYTRSDAVWHRYMRTAGRRVLEYHNPDRTAASTLYIFPLQVGNRWISNPTWHDTSFVTMIDTVPSLSRVFENAFFIERKWQASGSSGRADTWFVPRIGIVKLNLWATTSMDTTRELWELIDCKVEIPPDSSLP